MHVFTYGSLMFADIFEGVTGQQCRFQNATLQEWFRHALRDRTYPGAASSSVMGDQIAGVLWLDVCASSLLKLDAFEGSAYRREAVTVLSEDAQTQTAWIYRWIDESLFCGAWDVQAFAQQHRANFLALHGLPPVTPPSDGRDNL